MLARGLLRVECTTSTLRRLMLTRTTSSQQCQPQRQPQPQHREHHPQLQHDHDVDYSGAPGWSQRNLPVFVLRDFVTADEEVAILEEAEPRVSRRAYENSHWDSVIRGYRETQFPLSSCGPVLQRVFDRLRLTAGQFSRDPLVPSVHVIDLSAEGIIDFHVDSVKFSGDLVCGLSLRSDSVMQLRPDTDGAPAVASRGDGPPLVQLFLRRRSLYILHGDARYKWGHAIPSGRISWPTSNDASSSSSAAATTTSAAAANYVEKGRRISFMWRNELPAKGTTGAL